MSTPSGNGNGKGYWVHQPGVLSRGLVLKAGKQPANSRIMPAGNSREPYVNIGVVTYNRLEFTTQSLPAIKRLTTFPYVLTVVDNASTDGSREYLIELHKSGVINNLVLLDQNIGVAKASNLAWCQEPNAAYYLKLDNDIVFQKPRWLENMIRTIDGIPELGAVGYNFEPKSYPQSQMRNISIRVKHPGNIGGACFLIPKRTEAKLGRWCEAYGLYGFEDVDYSTRISIAGLLNGYMPDEDIGIHLPAGKAAIINAETWEARDGMEEIQHKQYRDFKDGEMRVAVKNGWVRERLTAQAQNRLPLYNTSIFDNMTDTKDLAEINRRIANAAAPGSGVSPSQVVEHVVVSQPAAPPPPPSVKVDQFFEQLKQVVANDPTSRAAWNDLAKYAESSGMLDKAVAFATELSNANPTQIPILLAGAGLSILAKNAQSATEFYERILKIDPDNEEALRNLGRHRATPPPESGPVIAPPAEVLQLLFDTPEEWHGKALKLANSGQVKAASMLLKSLVASHPSHALAYNDLGVLCFQADALDEAEKYLKGAIELSPENQNAQRNLLEVYWKQKRFADASKVCEILIQLSPGDPKLLKLRQTLQELMNIKPQERPAVVPVILEKSAVVPAKQQDSRPQIRDEFVRRLLELKPEDLERNYGQNLGQEYRKLWESGIQDEPLSADDKPLFESLAERIKQPANPSSVQALLAAMLYRRPHLLNFQPDLVNIPKWIAPDYLGFLLSAPPLFQELGESDVYAKFMFKVAKQVGDVVRTSAAASFRSSLAQKFNNTLMCIPIYFNRMNLLDFYQERAEILESVHAGAVTDLDFRFMPRLRGAKIRLGIVVSGLFANAETFASLPIYEHLGDEFEVFLYATVASTGKPLEDFCRGRAADFKLLNGPLPQAIHTIRDDNLDILYFATNITCQSSLAAVLALFRLARIQISGPGSPTTSGMRHMDYFLSGELTDSASEADSHYIENLLKLKGSAHCFSYGSEIQTAGVRVTREELGLSASDVVFVSPANMNKLIPEYVDLLARILHDSPKAKLMLLPYGPNWQSQYPKALFERLLNKTLARHGVSRERLVVVNRPTEAELGKWSRNDVREFIKLADIGLDSIPFSGSTSLIEVLEAGLPIVTSESTTFRSAMGAALLKELGTPELVTGSDSEFVALACRLANERQFLHETTAHVRKQMEAKPRFLNSAAYGKEILELFKGLVRKLPSVSDKSMKQQGWRRNKHAHSAL